MKVPEFLHENDTIAVTAPSAGITEAVDLVRLENAKLNLEERGYRVVETPDVRKCSHGRSDTGAVRAQEFNRLFDDTAVKYIVSASGGDFLPLMLPFVDFEKISKNPKWFQGYSDNTGLTYTITTLADVMTVYAGNFSDYGMGNLHRSVTAQLDILEGKADCERGYRTYEKEFQDRITGLEGFNLTEEVKYESINESKDAVMNGRLLGGCLDVLISLCGTKFDHTKEFIQKYKSDGVIWYLESFALPSERLEIALWQLRQAGWFDTAKGFIFGRPCFFSSGYDTDFNTAVMSAIGDMKLPVITGADIGHRPPRLTILNGAMAEAELKECVFTLHYDLKKDFTDRKN